MIHTHTYYIYIYGNRYLHTHTRTRFLWLLEPRDEIIAVYNTARLSSGSAIRGVCVICSMHIYIFDQSFVKPNGEVYMFYDKSTHGTQQAPKSAATAAVGANNAARKSAVEKQASDGQAVCRLGHVEIRDIQRRNYLLRPVGLELFMSDGLNHLLIFHKSERETVIERMMQVCVYTYVCMYVYVYVCFVGWAESFVDFSQE